MSLRLAVELGRDRYAPGDLVEGTVLVLEGANSRGLDVALRFREEAEDDYEHTAVELSGGRLHEGALVAGGLYPFAIQLPQDALPGYRSAHGQLYWELDACSDERGRDTHERKRVEVMVSPS